MIVVTTMIRSFQAKNPSRLLSSRKIIYSMTKKKAMVLFLRKSQKLLSL